MEINNKEFVGVPVKGEKIIKNHHIIGLLRSDIKYFRQAPIIECFLPFKAGDITKFYFYSGDYQYRIRYDEDWVRWNQSKEDPLPPIFGTDFSQLSWYFELNRLPGIMHQYIPPIGRKDRKELSIKYNFDEKDEFNMVMFGGTGPYSKLRVEGYCDVFDLDRCRFSRKENTYGLENTK